MFAALNLVVVGLLSVVPIAGALKLSDSAAPDELGPLLIVGWGMTSLFLAIVVVHRTNWQPSRRSAQGASGGGATSNEPIDASGGSLPPPIVWLVPSLFTSGWMMVLAGLVWLAFTNLLAVVVTAVALVVIVRAALWIRRPPRDQSG